MLSRQEAEDLIAPLAPQINKAILEAWKSIHRSNLNIKARSRACLMFDNIVLLIRREFEGTGLITNIVEEGQTAHYWVGNEVYFRIKKSDDRGFTSNYPTQAAMEFHDAQKPLIPDSNKLEIGYVLNRDETEIQDIKVISRNLSSVEFTFSILDSETNVARIPDAEVAASPSSGTSIAKVKKQEHIKTKKVE